MKAVTVRTAKQFASVCVKTQGYSEWVNVSFQSALEWAFQQYVNGNITYLAVARQTGAKLPGRTNDAVTKYIEAACTNCVWDAKARTYGYNIKGDRGYKKPAKAWYFSTPTLDNMQANVAEAIEAGDEVAQAAAEAKVAVEEKRIADAQVMKVASKVKQLHDAIAKHLSEDKVDNTLAAEMAIADLDRLMDNMTLSIAA